MKPTALPVTLLLVVLTVACGGRYHEPVPLPNCDSADPAVLLIDEEKDWERVNDPAIRVFCVAPAVYTLESIGVITLSASGTKSEPRYLQEAEG